MALSRPRVLVGFAESLAAVETAWSLVDSGVEVHAFARAGARPALRRFRPVAIAEIPAPELDARAAVASTRELIRAIAPDVTMPLDDAALWLLGQAGEEAEAAIAGPTGERARLALDRTRQLAAAAEAGFAVPEFRRFDRPAEVTFEEFPVVVRPAEVVSERRGKLIRRAARACADTAELRSAVAGWGADEAVLVQRWVSGTGEGVFGLARAGDLRAVSAHRRLRMMNPGGSGSSACMSIAVDPELRNTAARFVSNARWNGVLMVELLREPSGRAWFIELNGRPWGSMALARRTGFEYPAWAVSLGLDPTFTIPEPPGRPGLVCRHAGRELVHLAYAFRGAPSPALAETWPSRGDAARAVLAVRRSERWYNCRPGARMVFVSDTLTTLRGALQRGGR